jgi:hypothetical protein
MTLSLKKEKEKEWTTLIKQAVKINGWKYKGWFAYRVVEDFFYEATFCVSVYGNSISSTLEFKPLVIDDTFWDIVNLNENKKMPLSFRGNGAFVVGSKDVCSFDLKIVPESLKTDIEKLINTINLKVDKVSSNINNVKTFIEYIKYHPSKRSEWFDSDLLIVSSIVQKNYDKALELLDYAKKTRGMCGWSFGDKNFYDLAIDYCQRHE